MINVKLFGSRFNLAAGLKANFMQNERRMSSSKILRSPSSTGAQNGKTSFYSAGAQFNVITDVRTNSALSSVSLTGSNIELNDLECEISGRKLIFNLTWLRDSCHCDKCTHRHSRQRLFTPNDFERHKFAVKDVRLIAGTNHDKLFGPNMVGQNEGILNIDWADGHTSFYSLNWLDNLHKLYDKSQLHLGQTNFRPTFKLPNDDYYSPRAHIGQNPEYWTVKSICSKLHPVDYRDLIDGFEFRVNDPTFINANKVGEMSQRRFSSILSLTEQLTELGLAKITNVPMERNQVLSVARSLAYERPTGYGTIFDVVVEPSEEINLAYSSQEFDLHSDLTYRENSPGVQLLHCIRNSIEGGFSYFSDAFHAANQLFEENPTLFEVLVQFPATFVVRDPYRDMKFRRHKQILNLDHNNQLNEVYYSPFMLPPVGARLDLKLFYLALDKFTQLLQSEGNKLITKMDPGDLFIFHNRRVLHGRSSYDPTTSGRFLQGCYMDWDEISCLNEKLHSHNKY